MTPIPTTAAVRELVARRTTLADQAARRRLLNGALAVPCDGHDARRGMACWTLPADALGRPDHPAVCGPRLALARRVAERERTSAATRGARP